MYSVTLNIYYLLWDVYWTLLVSGSVRLNVGIKDGVLLKLLK